MKVRLPQYATRAAVIIDRGQVQRDAEGVGERPPEPHTCCGRGQHAVDAEGADVGPSQAAMSSRACDSRAIVARVEDLVDRFVAGDDIGAIADDDIGAIADDFGVPVEHVEDIIRVARRTAA